jgi:hypothetical protein
VGGWVLRWCRLMPVALNLSKSTFGLLTAVEPVGRQNGKVVWKCYCACGGQTEATASNLRSGNSTNCGCVRRLGLKQRNTTHGLGKPPEYNSWANMIQRCHNSDHPKFLYYGGRGISVCSAWRESFPAFLAHIGPRPSPRHSIDRFPDNNGNYEPGNVRWATQKEQIANSRSRSAAVSAALKKVHAERPGFNLGRRAKNARL